MAADCGALFGQTWSAATDRLRGPRGAKSLALNTKDEVFADETLSEFEGWAVSNEGRRQADFQHQSVIEVLGKGSGFGR